MLRFFGTVKLIQGDFMPRVVTSPTKWSPKGIIKAINPTVVIVKGKVYVRDNEPMDRRALEDNIIEIIEGYTPKDGYKSGPLPPGLYTLLLKLDGTRYYRNSYAYDFYNGPSRGVGLCFLTDELKTEDVRVDLEDDRRALY